MGVVPTQVGHQGRGVVGIVGHAVGLVGLVGTAEPPLVVGYEVEALSQRPVELVGLVTQVAAGAGYEQQALPRTRALVIDLQALELGDRHDGVLVRRGGC
jgi:hypothetical protein